MTKEMKERINRRKIAWIYLLHRMFEGNAALMIKIMGISGLTPGDIEDWNKEYKEAVYKTIEEEDAKGVQMRNPCEDVPSIKGIKEKVLRRVDYLIAGTDDPARLATVYKILSEFEVSDDRKEKSVLDAINDAVKPLTPQKKNTVTMLEKMRSQGMAPGAPLPERRKAPEDGADLEFTED